MTSFFKSLVEAVIVCVHPNDWDLTSLHINLEHPELTSSFIKDLLKRPSSESIGTYLQLFKETKDGANDTYVQKLFFELLEDIEANGAFTGPLKSKVFEVFYGTPFEKFTTMSPMAHLAPMAPLSPWAPLRPLAMAMAPMAPLAPMAQLSPTPMAIKPDSPNTIKAKDEQVREAIKILGPWAVRRKKAEEYKDANGLIEEDAPNVDVDEKTTLAELMPRPVSRPLSPRPLQGGNAYSPTYESVEYALKALPRDTKIYKPNGP